MGKHFFLKLFLSTTFVSICLSMEVPMTLEQPGRMDAGGCHRRVYTYRAAQIDSKGYECWDNVSVMSCYGRCDSNEISDWKFPYKKSHHPVCVHSARSKAVAMLRNCHPLADESAKRYEYMEAKACHCQTCSTSDTSCEAPQTHVDVSPFNRILHLAGADDENELEY